MPGTRPNGSIVRTCSAALLLTAACGEGGPSQVEELTDRSPDDGAVAGSPSIETTSLPDGRTGEPFTAGLEASGGVRPYAWGLLGGRLPGGLSILDDGKIEGTPLASGGVDFRVVVIDQHQRADTADLSIEVALAFPEPELVLDGSEVRSAGGGQFIQYDLSVANWTAYGSELFESRPDLPPCGLNANASRTWVEIFDAFGRRLYGFCALRSGSELNGIWFAVPVASEQPTGAYIELWDRALDIRVRSNTVTIPPG